MIQALSTVKWYQNIPDDVHNVLLRNELTTTIDDGDTLLPGHRLVIPATLETETVDLAHEGNSEDESVVAKTYVSLESTRWWSIA